MKFKKLLAAVLSCMMLFDGFTAMAGADLPNVNEEEIVESTQQAAEGEVEEQIEFFYLKSQENAVLTGDIAVGDGTVLTKDFPEMEVNQPFYLTLGTQKEEQTFDSTTDEINVMGENFFIEPVAQTEALAQVFKVTPLKEGTHEISAYLADEKAASVEITAVSPNQPTEGESDINPPVQEDILTPYVSTGETSQQTQITLNETEKSIIVGETVQLTAQTVPESPVVWESENPAIASVSETGLVTGLKEGSVSILAKVGQDVVSCKITVEKPTIKLNKSSVSVYKGYTTTIKATAYPQTQVTYTSSNKKIATVDSNGKITGIKAGEATITAKANGVTAVCVVTVKNPSIKLSKTKLTVYVGYPVTLTAKTYPTSNAKYVSSKKAIATVDSNGKITAKKAGTATITVSANGVKQTCTITVKNPSIKLMESNLIIFENNSYKLSATAYPAKTMKWKTSSSKIATVDQNGIIIGKKAGEAKITVSFGKVSKTCKVTVLKNNYTLNKKSKTLMKGSSIKLYMNNIDSEANGYTTYSVVESSGDNIVSLTNENNICTVKGLKKGKVTINATYYYYHGGALVACTNSAVIKVTDEGIVQQQSSIAAKTKKQLSLKGINKKGVQVTKTVWKSSNTKVATVNKTSGLVTGKTRGSAKITATVYYSDKTTASYQTGLKVSTPKMKQKTKLVSVGTSYKISLSGLTNYSNVTWKSKKKSVAAVTVDGRVTTTEKTGTATITATVDGQTLTQQIHVTNPQLTEYYKPIAVGSKTKIQLTGTTKKSKITYKSQNKGIATVTSKGVVKATGQGYTVIEITADGKKLYFEVNVGSKKAISAIHKAKEIMYSSTYSQPYRMSQGYYDCSSLTFRAYQPNATGLLGGGNAWAPTAAAQAQYLESRGKVVALGPVDVTQLQPGDLLFFSGSYNGRYKNINHVSMYYGGGLRIEKPMRVYYPLNNLVLVARPTM